ncbi:protein transport protein Sec16A-like isoform X2 [Gigantopelta aegis]|uniref:protein transport protein Sec16A-like isoform X2 n=1 Tax=Gigantopelta aegis TaxID=1735272 RepID=UPI001B88CAF7|nr:protein transport protein Sec16A-like isoform X2 [Gigantopelta aegis]
MSQSGPWNVQSVHQEKPPGVQLYDPNSFHNPEVTPVSEGYPVQNSVGGNNFDPQHAQTKGQMNPNYNQPFDYSQQNQGNAWNHNWQASSNIISNEHANSQQSGNLQTDQHGIQQQNQQSNQWQNWDPTTQQYWQDQTWGDRGDSVSNLALGHGENPHQNVQQSMPPAQNWESGVNPQPQSSEFTYPASTQSQNDYSSQHSYPQNNISGFPPQMHANPQEETYRQNVHGVYGNNFFQPNSMNVSQGHVDVSAHFDQQSLNSVDDGPASLTHSVASSHEYQPSAFPVSQENPLPLSQRFEDSMASSDLAQLSETSSMIDQSTSLSQLDQSHSSSHLEESVSSEGGTVAGFFCKDDSEDIPTKIGDNYLGNQSEMHQHISDFGDSSLAKTSYFNEAPVENVHNDVKSISDRFQNVSLSNKVPTNDKIESSELFSQNVLYNNTNRSALITPDKSNLHQSDGNSQAVTVLEEDQQTSALNDWELIPRENSQHSFESENVAESISFTDGALSAANTFIAPASFKPETVSSENRPPPSLSTNAPASSNAVYTDVSKLPVDPSGSSLSAMPHQQNNTLSKVSPVIFNPDPSKVSSPSKPEDESYTSPLLTSRLSSQRPTTTQNQVVSSTTVPFQPNTSVDSQSHLTSTEGVNNCVNVSKSTNPIPPVPGSSVSNTDSKLAPVLGNRKPVPAHIPAYRQHPSAFHPVTSRSQHNMSPATSLWDNVEPPAMGIILAPAAPLTNAESTTAATATSAGLPVIPMTTALESKLKSSSHVSLPKREVVKDSRRQSESSRVKGEVGDELSDKYKAHIRRNSRDMLVREDDNRSINSLDEIDAKADYGDGGYGRLHERYAYRDPRYEDPYNRHTGQMGGYRDYPRHYYRGQRDYYNNPYYDERYDRPRSRHDQNRPASRPSSTSVDDGNQTQMHADYSRDQYKQWDRYRGYYNYHGQRHEDHDAYYRYYQQHDARYNSAYYDELGYARYGQAYDPRLSDYYSQFGAPSTDDYDRASVHSQSRGNTPALDDTGRQSADYYGHHSRSSSRHGYNEPERSQQGYGSYGYDNYAYGYDSYYGQGSYYQGDYYQQVEKPTGRLTPPKYSIPHVRACFGPNGQLVKVLPNRPADGQPALVQVEELGLVLSDTREADDLKTFPGPLTQSDTHKTDVLCYCQQKSKQCAEDINMLDRESAQLMWKLLERLIKQNGTVIGTDIADLLLEDHEPSTHEYSMIGMKISRSLDELDTPDDDNDEESTPKNKLEVDRSLVTRSTVLEEATDRFRNLVLYGRKKDALECAMKNHLWGHALFLASKMDTRTHANVMIRFANSAMKMNDPLQTLYQLMSGRQPAAVTCVSDERWGDWRPHLAMILSNHSSKPDHDRKCISILGDTLASKGCLHASHFCYIMAQTGFGTFSKKTSKLVLIGASHNLPLEQFITNEAIQCTEVYEYAQSLSNPTFFLPLFQVYKFIYAARLAEYGFPQEALHYCEVISTAVQHSPAWFQPAFVKVLYEMANRLKFHDPQRLQEGDDADDAVWLQQLHRICLGYEDGSIQPVSGNATPAFMVGTSASSDSGDVNYTGTQDYSTAAYQQEQQGSGYQFGSHQQTDAGQYASQPAGQPGHTGQIPDIQNTVYSSQWQSQYGTTYGYQAPSDEPAQTDNTGMSEYPSTTGYENTGSHPDPIQSQYQTDGTQSHRGSFDQYSQDGMSQTHRGSVDQYSGVGRLQSQRGSVVSTHSLDVQNEEALDPSQATTQEGNSSAFDYFAAATGQIVAPPSRFRTTSESSSVNASSGGRRRTISGSSTGSVKAANSSKSRSAFDVPKSVKEEKSPQKSKSNDKNNKGWFSGIFGWKSKKNEMILPDDKKPTIVWDETKKRWLNTDASVEDTQAPEVKPPKDTELLGNLHGASEESSIATSNSPSANRFSRQNRRGARNQYVDVLNPKSSGSSVKVPSSLFNVMPSGDTPPPAQIFNPLNASSTSSQSTVPSTVQPHASSRLEPPAQDEHVSRSSSMSSLSREVEQLTMQPTSENSALQATTSGPVLFNPTQFQNQQHAASKPGSGMKYGQRRQYPK